MKSNKTLFYPLIHYLNKTRNDIVVAADAGSSLINRDISYAINSTQFENLKVHDIKEVCMDEIGEVYLLNEKVSFQIPKNTFYLNRLSYKKDYEIDMPIVEIEKPIIMITGLFDTIFNSNLGVDLKYEFNRFFCMQYFRSPRVHTNTKKNVEDFKQSYEAANDMTTNFLTNMMMVYFAERMALNITQHFKSSILLYKNQTGVPFITGDTPIVCLTGQEMNGMSIFHYPISPIIAMELIIIPKYSDWATISKNFVMELNQEFVDVVKNCNRKLADNCVNEIYSNTKDSLLKLMEEFEPNNP